jgi:hypothetical protein
MTYQCPILNVRDIGYMDVVEELLPYRNATETFLTIFDLE